jgi:hypothetical protein
MVAPVRPREATATIRGYIYQFDATIRKLLALDPGSTLTIEGVEDFDESASLADEYSQVKYYAAQKLTDAVIRDAILPMLVGFLTLCPAQRTTKRYVLYGYFKESSIGQIVLDITDMKRILVKGRFEDGGGKKTLVQKNLCIDLKASDADLTDFAARIIILIADEYHMHKSLTVQELRAALGVGSAEAEGFSYPSALTVVSELAAAEMETSRIITRQQFLSLIRPSAAIYNEWSLREESESAYCKKMRARHFSSLNVESIERFFVLAGIGRLPARDVEEVARRIVEKWSTYNSHRKPDNERFAPYLFFPGIAEATLIEVMQALADDGLLVVDGFMFFGSRLDLHVIQEPQTRHRPIAARFIGSHSQMSTILANIRKRKIIIQLYIGEQADMPVGHRQIAIPVTSPDMMKTIL